ncbi:hypothetical protein AB0424_02880 [Streptomyces sp. NPDC051180]|uniref:hypothetical protein n=1 Tax=Streptomyces sp. NPDC051180 TaxID=3155797 RepID=UPI00344BB95B
MASDWVTHDLAAGRTSETYLGASRIRGYTGIPELVRERATVYACPPAGVRLRR